MRKDLDETPRSVNPVPQNADYWKRPIGRIGVDGVRETVKTVAEDSKEPMIEFDEDGVYCVSESSDAWVPNSIFRMREKPHRNTDPAGISLRGLLV